MEVVSINVGMPQTVMHQGKELLTGICKTPVSSPLRLCRDQLEGDGQGDLIHHGGPDKALCVYPVEHYRIWESRLGKKFPYGTFGENVTVRGLLETDVCIGDIFRLGEAVVQVTQPRQPCFKLAARLEVPDMVVQVQETGMTGYYFRVLEEGMLYPRPLVQRQHSDPGGVSIAEANRLKYRDKRDIEAIRRILGIEALSESWRESFASRLAELGE